MADTWFRFYNDAVLDPKVQRLSGDMFKMWVNILCLASKFGGALPKDDMQYSLRMSETKAKQTIDFFIERNLLDDLGDIVTPHNWDGRQYKSDNADPTNAERQKRYRKSKSNAPVTGDSNGSNAVTITPTEQNRADTEQIDDDDEARKPLISEQANRIADSVALICGHDLKFVPPAWCGAAYRVQTWVNEGWSEEIILASCREQMANKRDGPPERIQYFEKGIASAVAKQNAPLPEVKVLEAQTVEVRRGTTENLPATARRLAESGVSFGERPSLVPRTQGGSNVIRVLPEGGRK